MEVFPRAVADNEHEHEPDSVVAEVVETPVSVTCAACGTELAYSGSGRPRRTCSDVCRTQAWALRRAARDLGLALPPPVTTVVERTVVRVIERTIVRAPDAAPVAASPALRTTSDWVDLLEQLERTRRTNPVALARSRDEFHDLRRAVAALADAFAVGATTPPITAVPPPLPGAGTGLSRQQRRALEREQRKR
jgi:hypothetical protein